MARNFDDMFNEALYGKRRRQDNTLIDSWIDEYLLEDSEEEDIDRSPIPIPRRWINRDREAGHDRLFQDYFADEPRVDATGRRGLSPLQKCTAAIRMLAYGVAADAVDDYVRIGESTTIELSNPEFIYCVLLWAINRNWDEFPTGDGLRNIHKRCNVGGSGHWLWLVAIDHSVIYKTVNSMLSELQHVHIYIKRVVPLSFNELLRRAQASSSSFLTHSATAATFSFFSSLLNTEPVSSSTSAPPVAASVPTTAAPLSLFLSPLSSGSHIFSASQPSSPPVNASRMYGVALELNSHQIMLLLLWIVWWQGRMLLQEGTLMLLREKHIGKRLYIDLPDAKQRVQIFGVHSSGKQLAKDVDFEKLVFRTVGFSGADIKNLVNEAAIMMVRKGHSKISQQDIIDVLDKQLLEGMGVLLTEEEQ
ncbi:ATP-dependent zinc metalloprotease FTSH 12 [Arachis hypogaea]|nr:ATP-dependent zinc metalloprotease FTSH 12 [Arachis hypogaea]